MDKPRTHTDPPPPATPQLHPHPNSTRSSTPSSAQLPPNFHPYHQPTLTDKPTSAHQPTSPPAQPSPGQARSGQPTPGQSSPAQPSPGPAQSSQTQPKTGGGWEPRYGFQEGLWPAPADEEERLRVLHSISILDSAMEASFEHIADWYNCPLLDAVVPAPC